MLKENIYDGNLKAEFFMILLGIGFVVLGSGLLYTVPNLVDSSPSYSLSVTETSQGALNNSTETITPYKNLTSKEKSQFRKSLAETVELRDREGSSFINETPSEPISGSWTGPEYVTLDGTAYNVTQIEQSNGGGLLVFLLSLVSAATIVVGFLITLVGCGNFLEVLYAAFPTKIGILLIIGILCVSFVFGYGILQMTTSPIFEEQTVIGEKIDTQPENATVIHISNLSQEQKDEFYMKSQSGDSLDKIAYQENTYIRSDGEFYKLTTKQTFTSITDGIFSILAGWLGMFWVVTLACYLVLASFELYEARKLEN